MRAIFTDQDGKEVGEVLLVDDVAVPSTDELRELLLDARIVAPNDPDVPLTFRDGVRFVGALPHNFRNPYLRVSLGH
jgi:hypothetical protein